MPPPLTPQIVDALLRELEAGMNEVFFHSVQHATGMKLHLPAENSEDVLFAMAAWTRGDSELMKNVLTAVAGHARGEEKSAWARSLNVAAGEVFALRRRAAGRLRAIVEAERAAAQPIEAGAIVMTLGRRPEICTALLNGYHAECAAPLVVCNNGLAEIGALPGNPRIVPPPSEEYVVLKSMLLPPQRYMIDCYRALALGEGDVLLFEDDVRLCHGWAAALDLARQTLRERGEEPGFIWLMETAVIETPRGTVQQKGRDTTEPVVSLPSSDFNGVQAIWIPAATRQKIVPALAASAFETYKLPFDLALRSICEKAGLGFFATGRALVQHIKTDEKLTPGFQNYAKHLLGPLY